MPAPKHEGNDSIDQGKTKHGRMSYVSR